NKMIDWMFIVILLLGFLFMFLGVEYYRENEKFWALLLVAGGIIPALFIIVGLVSEWLNYQKTGGG
ncbi:unnamed protein product, partial [marine sediment metagenome]